ncbi:MAG: hypothetical protein JWO36_373 [Myxococcales bacterium]|nr:hypothetical protein [Myxococcales bacterium]
MAETWLKCSACKNPITFGANHWVCSVSTCNRSRMRLVFCTVSCWDSHVAILRHRDAWAVDAKAPSKDQWERELAAMPPEPEPAPKPAGPPAVRRMVSDTPSAPLRSAPPPAAQTSAHPPTTSATGIHLQEAEHDILIVVSKVKKYIKDRSGMNTSDAVVDLLSDHIRAICDDGIRAAARDDRKTVLERDLPRPRK